MSHSSLDCAGTSRVDPKFDTTSNGKALNNIHTIRVVVEL